MESPDGGGLKEAGRTEQHTMDGEEIDERLGSLGNFITIITSEREWEIWHSLIESLRARGVRAISQPQNKQRSCFTDPSSGHIIQPCELESISRSKKKKNGRPDHYLS